MASIFDQVASSTIGVLWRARYGTVDPWTLEVMKQDEGDARIKASGPVSAQQAVQIQAQVAGQIDSQLASQGAHPNQSPSFLDMLASIFPSMKTARDFLGYLVTFLIVGAIVYFAVVYRAPISKAAGKLSKTAGELSKSLKKA